MVRRRRITPAAWQGPGEAGANGGDNDIAEDLA
jgi:hypothetical protein